ncbi:DUF362 domain-containing protein [Candidatus Thorarchaeota archaeon]|nr:MAG: DUF362 domain-containing protein [Candidatus Thorarchaeota archaeon]
MSSSAEVAIAVKRNPWESLQDALSRLSSPLHLDGKLRQILVKPSLYDPILPGNTSLEMTLAVARVFRHAASISVVESDNPKRTAEEAFRQLDYTKLEAEGFRLINLSQLDTVPAKFAGHAFFERPIPDILASNPFIVNVSTAKRDDSIGLGASIKNLFGLLPEGDKARFHDNLTNVLLDLLLAFRPALTVVDLTRVVVGSRTERHDVPVGGVIVGTDPVAVDAFCASLFGLVPMDIPYIRRAFEEGIGQAMLDKISVRGTENQKRRLFEAFSEHVRIHK